MKSQWVRKTEGEIEEVKKKSFKSSFSPVMPVGISFFAFLIMPYFSSLAPQAPESVPIIGTIIVFIVVYSYQIYTGRSLVRPGNKNICNNCMKEDYLSNKNCACGGVFEPEDYFIDLNATKDIPADVKDGEQSRKFKRQILTKVLKTLLVAFFIICILIIVVTSFLIFTKGYHEAIKIMSNFLTNPYLLLGLYLFFIPLSAFFKHERHSF